MHGGWIEGWEARKNDDGCAGMKPACILRADNDPGFAVGVFFCALVSARWLLIPSARFPDTRALSSDFDDYDPSVCGTHLRAWKRSSLEIRKFNFPARRPRLRGCVARYRATTPTVRIKFR